MLVANFNNITGMSMQRGKNRVRNDRLVTDKRPYNNRMTTLQRLQQLLNIYQPGAFVQQYKRLYNV